MVYVVETITDTSTERPKTVHRGQCGLAAESAVVPPPAPAPQITTKAPAHAVVGHQITDEATLTGPYREGDQIDFWYQTSQFTNPDAPVSELTCAKPHPHDMTGATHIGTATLNHNIPTGTTETIQSPQFTTDKPGCTFIKETATRPGHDEPTTLADGWFGAADETTIWTAPPDTIAALPDTGAGVRPGVPLGSACLLVGGLVMGVAYWRRKRADGDDRR
jgi:hypothetical protein